MQQWEKQRRLGQLQFLERGRQFQKWNKARAKAQPSKSELRAIANKALENNTRISHIAPEQQTGHTDWPWGDWSPWNTITRNGITMMERQRNRIPPQN